MRKSLFTGARLGVMAAGLAIAFAVLSTGAVKKPIIKKPTHDPKAEAVELFAAIEAGQIDAKLILKDEFEGNVFIENKTDKPLTIKLPRSAVGVQVLKQGFGPMAGGMGQQGTNPGNNGQAQQGGGGFGGFGGGGMGMMGGGGMGFPSVPSEKIIQIPFTSVCLNHGKPTPKAHMTYKLVPTETYTKNTVLQEMLAAVATGKLNRNVAQAATWHLTDDMSWEELAAKMIKRTGGLGNQPYFSREEILAAMSLVKAAEAKARENNDGELKTEKKL
jgi:hypothetical protein